VGGAVAHGGQAVVGGVDVGLLVGEIGVGHGTSRL
jgi:hypothetical protein